MKTGFTHTVTLNEVEYALVYGLVEDALTSVEAVNSQGGGKPIDVDIHEVLTNILIKLVTKPNINN
jgi:hypothetical protein